MSKWQYTKGLHDLGHGNHAYLLPDGGWGWSNAGLIVDGEQNLLVDTLFDLKLTQEMLDVCAERGIGCDVELIKIQDVETAYERLLKSDVRYRFVIDMASLKDSA